MNEDDFPFFFAFTILLVPTAVNGTDAFPMNELELPLAKK